MMQINGTNGQLQIGNTVIPIGAWESDMEPDIAPESLASFALPQFVTFTFTITRIRVGPFWMPVPDPGPSRN